MVINLHFRVENLDLPQQTLNMKGTVKNYLDFPYILLKK